MKQSLLTRVFITVSILCIWGFSLFPLYDKPLYDVLQKEAGERANGQLQELIEEAKKIDNRNPGSLITPTKAILKVSEEKSITLRDYVPIYDQPEASNQVVISYLRRKSAGKLKLGLDLKGGTEFVIAFDEKLLAKNAPDKTTEQAQEEIIEILRNRVDQSGLVDAQVQPTGPTTISLKIPSIVAEDVHRYRKTIAATARLEFRAVHENNASLIAQANSETFTIPVGYERMVIQGRDNTNSDQQVIYVSRFAEPVNGSHIKRAFHNIDEFGSHSVSLEFTFEGAKLFYEATQKYVGKRLAIVLDGTVYSAPTINEPISGGRAEISGRFSQEEAAGLSVVLRCGNLPVPIRIEGEFSTDPTLGHDSVKSGTYAAITGLILVASFMIIYYRTAGVIANIALVANILLILGTLTIAGATITLPGIAGIVLTIGMAVDANVLIFERIREEIWKGKSIGNAIRNGYDRAFVTIIDANITTLVAAGILYWRGSGAIRGFAITLTFGICASLFTSLFMTRILFDALLMSGRIKKLPMMHLFRTQNINFLGGFKVASMLSVLLLIGSLLTVVLRGKSALGVDFQGGTAITFNYEKEIPAAEISSFLADNGYEDVRVSYKHSAYHGTELMEIVFGGLNPQTNEDVKTSIKNLFHQKYPEAQFAKGTTKSIGGLVGKQFTWQASEALLAGLIAIVFYITARFEFSYALGAVAALIHDIVISIGIFLVANMGERQLSLPVVAAVLTIIGYSLNDTIVVFDRIRENLGLVKKKTLIEIINMSINETLSRTVLTSITTLVVVFALYFFGGGGINDFALLMLTGIFVGTYSSIFVATPVMFFWNKRKQNKEKNMLSASNFVNKTA